MTEHSSKKRKAKRADEAKRKKSGEELAADRNLSVARQLLAGGKHKKALGHLLQLTSSQASLLATKRG